MSNNTFSAGGPSSSLDRSIEELEAQRTVGLTRMLPADPSHSDVPDAMVSESEKHAMAEADIEFDPREIDDSTLAEAYDATLDPRTGRPPNPLEAQRIAREHELERPERAETPEDVEKIYGDDELASAEDADPADEDGETDSDVDETLLSTEQAPARMTSPGGGEQDKAAISALVQEGIARERAEELVDELGTDWETLKAAAWPLKTETATFDAERKAVLQEHHVEGIPPFETPGEKA